MKNRLNVNNQIKGSFYILLSSFFFGSYGIWAKLIGTSLDNFYQVWTRSLLILIVIIPIAFITKQIKSVKKGDIKWIALYAGAGAFTVAPIFYAFNIIGIGPSTLMFYASLTIVSYLFGVISFGEKMTPIKIAALILAMVGLLLIFNLSVSGGTLIAAAAAIIAGSAAGIEVIFTKKVSDTYSPLELSIFTWAVIFASHIILSKILGEQWIPISLNLSWLAVLGYAVSSLFAFFLVVLGFKYSEPSIASVVGLLEIIFAVVFGVIFFSETLSISIFLGCLFIIIAAMLPNIRELWSFVSKRNY
ncbi:MAG: DMT family transporter [Microgenomates group bacterium]